MVPYECSCLVFLFVICIYLIYRGTCCSNLLDIFYHTTYSNLLYVLIVGFYTLVYGIWICLRTPTNGIKTFRF